MPPKYRSSAYWKAAINPLNSTAGYAVPHAVVIAIIALAVFATGAFSQHAFHLIPEVATHPTECAKITARGQAHCDSLVVNTPHFKGVKQSVYSIPYGPPAFHAAYSLPCTPGGPVQETCPQPASYANSPVISIIDATGDSTAESDLAAFDARYGLPECSSANGCLSILNQNGQPSNLPANGGWEDEENLDLQTAHGICQTCRIRLYQANTADFNDLATAVNTAAAQGATVISNSYGASESSSDASFASAYNHPGVAIVASTGDSGYGTETPAAFPSVIGAGGTTLTVNGDGSYAQEAAWTGAGSGCSTQFPVNSWQSSVSDWSSTNCGSFRAVADVSADADPASGVAVYSQGTWQQVGGTSLSSPLLAGVIALAGGESSVSNPQSVPYAHQSAFHDVMRGSNGSCGTVICNSGVGYDGPTGLGSPNGVAGFQSNAPAPTPVPTARPTATPTTIPTVKPTVPAPKPTNTSVKPTSTPVKAKPTPTRTRTPKPRPTATKTPGKWRFPISWWDSYTSAHGLKPIPYTNSAGGILVVAWYYGHANGVAQKCGGVTTHQSGYAGFYWQHFARGEIIVDKYGGHQHVWVDC